MRTAVPNAWIAGHLTLGQVSRVNAAAHELLRKLDRPLGVHGIRFFQ